VNDERVRLFVALELPDEVREALLGWRLELGRSLANLRLIAPDSLHVTLCFLGWQAGSEVEAIEEACCAVGSRGRPLLVLRTGIWLPPRRPRVLAVSLEDRHGVLAARQAELSGMLERGGWYTPEARPFLAHVTVARVRKGARIHAAELPPLDPLEFEGRTVTLFRSRLRRGGAQYEALRRVAV
jgi:2'-5' RNA ligase